VYEGTISIIDGLLFHNDLNNPLSVTYGSVSQVIEDEVTQFVLYLLAIELM
jgi:hypothetical protein